MRRWSQIVAASPRRRLRHRRPQCDRNIALFFPRELCPRTSCEKHFQSENRCCSPSVNWTVASLPKSSSCNLSCTQIVCFLPVCGRKGPHGSGKIIGGTDAGLHEYPWQARDHTFPGMSLMQKKNIFSSRRSVWWTRRTGGTCSSAAGLSSPKTQSSPPLTAS